MNNETHEVSATHSESSFSPPTLQILWKFNAVDLRTRNIGSSASETTSGITNCLHKSYAMDVIAISTVHTIKWFLNWVGPVPLLLRAYSVVATQSCVIPLDLRRGIVSIWWVHQAFHAQNYVYTVKSHQNNCEHILPHIFQSNEMRHFYQGHTGSLSYL